MKPLLTKFKLEILNKTGSDASTQEKIEHIELSKTIINNQMKMINQLKDKL